MSSSHYSHLFGLFPQKRNNRKKAFFKQTTIKYFRIVSISLFANRCCIGKQGDFSNHQKQEKPFCNERLLLAAVCIRAKAPLRRSSFQAVIPLLSLLCKPLEGLFCCAVGVSRRFVTSASQNTEPCQPQRWFTRSRIGLSWV